MGFLGFLRFSLFCFDFLAWPAFALGYPLWASIRAIETSSKSQMRKLVTYWTIFSFISLFEFFCSRFVEWVPFWPYMKLVMIYWLVIPKFDGACHVYNCVIHPCLSINLQDVISWFSIRKEKTFAEETFLTSAKKFIEENGADAMETLIANEVPEIQLEQPKPPLFQSEKTEMEVADTQKATVPTDSTERRSLEIRALKKVQREWTCAMCQVTTTSEATLNSHLLGNKHKSECEKLNTSTVKQKDKPVELNIDTQTEKSLKSSALKTNESVQAKENLKHSPSEEGSRQNTTERPKNDPINEPTWQQMAMNTNVAGLNSKFWCGICNIGCTRERDMTAHLKGKKHVLEAESKTMNTNAGAVNQQPKLWCRICNVKCTNEMDMSAHLKGRRHEIEVQSKPMNKNAGVISQQPKLWCEICNVKCTNEMNMSAHLKGRRHEIEVQSKPMNKNAGVISQQPKLWCEICNVKCTNEMDMSAHLKGRRHEIEVQSKPMNTNAGVVNQQPKLWCRICNVKCNNEKDMSAHLKGRRHEIEVQSSL